jgi:hypothetical protein
VLHSVQRFVPNLDGLALLAYSKTGDGYASLFGIANDQPQALQMAKVLSIGDQTIIGADQWFHELYLQLADCAMYITDL